MAGEYTPRYKTGYTVLSQDEDVHYVVLSTFRGLNQFSHDFPPHSDYDERDKDHVLYALFDISNNLTCWRWENVISVYCCNPNRGKKQILEPRAFKRVCQTYSIHDEGLVKFKAMLEDQTET